MLSLVVFFEVSGNGRLGLRGLKLLCPNTNPPQTLRSLVRNSKLDYFLLLLLLLLLLRVLLLLLLLFLYRMSKLPSIEQRRQKGDKRRYTSPLRQHSWACMVSFPRRLGNTNAHFMHPISKMRDTRCGMVKWRSSRGTRG